MPVVYTYPDENQRTVLEGDSWSVETSVINTTLWQATGKATNNLVEPDHPERIVGWSCRPALSSQSGNIVEVDVSIFGGFVTGRSWAIQSGTKRPTLFKTQSIYQENWWLEPWYVPGDLIRGFSPPTLYHWQYPQTAFGYDTSTRNYYYTDVVLTYWHPADGDPIYTLRIFDSNNSEIFNRTENERPIQVFKTDNVCPPNTCPVDCGDKICCYGSDGIAVSSLLK